MRNLTNPRKNTKPNKSIMQKKNWWTIMQNLLVIKLNKNLFMFENIYLARLIRKIVNNKQKSIRQYI